MIETYENHAQVAREVLSSEERKEKKRRIKRVEITNQEGKGLLGISVGKSVILPLSIDRSSETFLNAMAEKNLETIGNDTLAPFYGACRFLRLPYSVKTDGIYADGDFFGTTVGLHLHPNGSIITEREFVKTLKDILSERGFRLSVGKAV
jgi:hypothetical protein